VTSGNGPEPTSPADSFLRCTIGLSPHGLATVGGTLRRFLGSIELVPQEPSAVGKLMTRVTECVVLMIALTALAQPALAASYLKCSTRKVVIISAPNGGTSSTREEEIMFVIDDVAKTLTFSDNGPLTITRLNKSWISANRDGIFYEFNRQDGSLTYASLTTQDGVTTTIVGSGQCAISPAPIR